jgi:hypothetical protein
MFLAPGAIYPGLPVAFAYPAALGDLLAALLALAAIPAVARASGQLLVWIFNVEGTLDLLAAIVLATLSVPRRSWAPPTGSRRSGYLRCW